SSLRPHPFHPPCFSIAPLRVVLLYSEAANIRRKNFWKAHNALIHEKETFMQNEYESRRRRGGGGSDALTKLTFLLIGGGIGAALALLFAPKSGEELRQDIADATRKSVDSARDTA